jgi:hypothetical protein
MNRVRMMLLAGVLGAFGFGTTSAQAQSMGSAPAPSYSYVPSAGYYSAGSNVITQPVPRFYGGSVFSAPAWSYRPSRPSPGSFMQNRVSSSYDPTGRHDRLARPWLR